MRQPSRKRDPTDKPGYCQKPEVAAARFLKRESQEVSARWLRVSGVANGAYGHAIVTIGQIGRIPDCFRVLVCLVAGFNCYFIALRHRLGEVEHRPPSVPPCLHLEIGTE